MNLDYRLWITSLSCHLSQHRDSYVIKGLGLGNIHFCILMLREVFRSVFRVKLLDFQRQCSNTNKSHKYTLKSGIYDDCNYKCGALQLSFTYSWLIWFWEATALSEKYGMIFAPQQEQNPRAEELSVIATLSRVMTEPDILRQTPLQPSY